MNENNINPEMNPEEYPESNYPESACPESEFPQSSYSQSGAPMDMPYPMPEFGEEKKSKTWQVALVAVVAVLIVALATVLIIVLQKRNQMVPPPPPPPMGAMISVSESGTYVNGQPTEIDFYIENENAFVSIEDVVKAAGYDCVFENNKMKILSNVELMILQEGSTEVEKQDQATKSKTTVEILRKPKVKDGELYVYARDLSMFMTNTSVTYNAMTGAVEINIGGGPGMPPGGMPPQGQAQPPQGQPPQGQAQPPQGQAPQGQPPQGQPPQGQPPQTQQTKPEEPQKTEASAPDKTGQRNEAPDAAPGVDKDRAPSFDKGGIPQGGNQKIKDNTGNN